MMNIASVLLRCPGFFFFHSAPFLVPCFASNGLYLWHFSEDCSQAIGAALLIHSENQKCLQFISSQGQALANHLPVHKRVAQSPCLDLEKVRGLFYAPDPPPVESASLVSFSIPYPTWSVHLPISPGSTSLQMTWAQIFTLSLPLGNPG